VLELKGHNSSVISVCYGPDGSYIASGDADGTIKIWELKYGNEIFQFVDNDDNLKNPCFCVAFSPDGKYISSGRSKTVKIWDIQKNKKIWQFNDAEYPIISLDYSHNNKYVVSGDDNSTIRVYNTIEGNLLFTASTGLANHISSVNFSPDDKYIVSGEWDGSIRIWDAINGNEIIELEGHKIGDSCAYTKVKYSPNGKFLVSGSWDQTVKIWNAETYEHIKTLTFLKNGQRDKDGGVIFPKGYSREEASKEMSEISGINYVEFSPDNKKILLLNQKGIIKIWDIDKNEEELKIFPILNDLC
jgi:WD40 repeat protein